jgi:hypothetical protein
MNIPEGITHLLMRVNCDNEHAEYPEYALVELDTLPDLISGYREQLQKIADTGLPFYSLNIFNCSARFMNAIPNISEEIGKQILYVGDPSSAPYEDPDMEDGVESIEEMMDWFDCMESEQRTECDMLELQLDCFKFTAYIKHTTDLINTDMFYEDGEYKTVAEHYAAGYPV